MPCILLHKGPKREALCVCAIKLARAQEHSSWKHWWKARRTGCRFSSINGHTMTAVCDATMTNVTHGAL